MDNWINLTALWQIVVVGLIAGAGLPAIFAVGMRLIALKGGSRAQTAGADGQSTDALVGGSVPGLIAGALCFLIVLAAIAWGIVAIYKAGHPH